MNDPTRTDSEIGLSLVEQIQSDCNRRRVCDVFLFSDLLDTKVKVSLHHNPDQANMLERSRAESLLKEFAIGSKSTSLRIRVWGFGRDDARPGLELPDQMRAPLRQYWIVFLGLSLRISPKEADARFRTSSPNVLRQGCASRRAPAAARPGLLELRN